MVGPAADDPVGLLGNYNGFSQKHVTPLAGMREKFTPQAVSFAMGAVYTAKSHALINEHSFRPPSGEGRGVRAEYFDNPDLQGQPKVDRIEGRPYLDGGGADPAIPKRNYSVRWTGFLNPRLSGDYIIGARGAMGVGPNARLLMHVFLDEREVLGDNSTTGLSRVREARVTLEANKLYKLRVEYKQPGVGGAPQLVWIPPADALLKAAVEVAQESDVTVAFVGLNANLEGEEMAVDVPGFKGGDRTDLNLPAPQERLLQAVVATGKPVVVVLVSGSALAANYAAEHAAAVLEAWYGGEEIGTAIADTLAGTNNPAGRLPVTFYKSVDQLPPFDDYAMKGKTYRYFTGEPLYGFGFGLSYSKFTYTRLRAQRDSASTRITVYVKNDSTRDGDEVVQLYVTTGSSPDDAIRQLKGFQRIPFRAGEARDVQFELKELPKGKVKISVGGGQPGKQVAYLETTL